MFYKYLYRENQSRLLATILLSGAFWVCNQQHSKAVTFNFSYGQNTSQELIDSTELAGGLWSSHLSDNVSLNIHIDFGALSDGLLGGARPNMVRVKYEDVLTAMLLDTTSSDDQLAFNNLQVNKTSQQLLQSYRMGDLNADDLKFSDKNNFSLLMQSSTPDEAKGEKASQSTFIDDNGNDNNKSIWMTRANAKALGLIDRADQDFDASIRFSDSVLWDLDRNDGIADNALDFLTVAQHEIGHALGIVSGSDVAAARRENSDKALDEKDLRYVSTMDLFRFSEESANTTFQTKDGQQVQGVADWTIGRIDEAGTPVDYYFSLDGGQTKIASLAKGTFGEGADGFQSSHWAPNGAAPLGIMHPSLALGKSLDISALDTQLLDALGWDLRSETGDVPAFYQAALFTKKGLVEEFWSLALDAETLASWLAETEQNLSDYVSEETLALSLEQQWLEQNRLELTQSLQSLSDLRDRQKEAGNDIEKKVTEAELKKIKDQLKQLDSDEKSLEKMRESLSKWQAKLLEELSKQQEELNKETERDLAKRAQNILKSQRKALQELSEQDGSDNPLTLGGWSSTSYSYRFWQTIDTQSSDDTLLTSTVFQMKSADKDVAETPEPTATLGLLALGFVGVKALRKQK